MAEPTFVCGDKTTWLKMHYLNLIDICAEQWYVSDEAKEFVEVGMMITYCEMSTQRILLTTDPMAVFFLHRFSTRSSRQT